MSVLKLNDKSSTQSRVSVEHFLYKVYRRVSRLVLMCMCVIVDVIMKDYEMYRQVYINKIVFCEVNRDM